MCLKRQHSTVYGQSLCCKHNLKAVNVKLSNVSHEPRLLTGLPKRMSGSGKSPAQLSLRILVDVETLIYIGHRPPTGLNGKKVDGILRMLPPDQNDSRRPTLGPSDDSGSELAGLMFGARHSFLWFQVS